MATFHYRAKKKNGETMSGEVQASTQDEALDIINQQGLLPVSIEERKTYSVPQVSLRDSRVSARDIHFISRQLAGLIKAGIPLLRALQIIHQQASKTRLKNALEDIGRNIKEGKSFSDALSLFPIYFSPFYIAMIKTGEESGSLKEILLQLAEHGRSQEEVASKVKTALAYPILMITVGLGTVIFILTFVMPRITNLFSSMSEELPLPTKILMTSSDIARIHGWWILISVIALWAMLYRWAKSPAGAVIISSMQLKTPLLGPFILKVELTRLCRSLKLMLKSGIPLTRGIKLSVPTVGNAVIRQELLSAQAGIETGNSFGQSLKQSGVIPSTMVNLVEVGEESGSLEEVLSDLADSYEQETNEIIKLMTTLLEPLMILVIGGIIGFMVMAMLLPIFQINTLAQ